MRIFAGIVLMFLTVAPLASGQARQPANLSELTAYVGADREQVLVKGAKAEGKVVWYTSLSGGSYKALARAFEEKYPGIKVEVYRHSSKMNLRVPHNQRSSPRSSWRL